MITSAALLFGLDLSNLTDAALGWELDLSAKAHIASGLLAMSCKSERKAPLTIVSGTLPNCLRPPWPLRSYGVRGIGFCVVVAFIEV